MTNRLELNWKLDGFVDEQRYYCSETPIDPENLPVPKAILASDVRTYVDTAIEVGKKYYVRLGAVKNNIEKLSDEKIVIADRDSYWTSVASLLHFDGENNSTVFSDEKGVSWTRHGNAKISTDRAKFGESSLRLDGYNSFLSAAAAIFTLGTQNFTVELWVNMVAYRTMGDGALLGYGTSTTNGFCIVIAKDNGDLGFWDGSLYYSTATPIPLNTWVHIAMCRNGNELSYFINGTKYVLTTSYTKAFNANSVFRLGGNYANTNENYLNAFIDDFRITKGVCRYLTSFIPPNLPFLDN